MGAGSGRKSKATATCPRPEHVGSRVRFDGGNRLPVLMRLHADGVDSETAYRKAILDWLLANDGRPNVIRRSITDPLGAPSLR